MDALRTEKAYRAWGHELGVNDTPLEAGLGFTVAWDKVQATTNHDPASPSPGTRCAVNH